MNRTGVCISDTTCAEYLQMFRESYPYKCKKTAQHCPNSHPICLTHNLLTTGEAAAAGGARHLSVSLAAGNTAGAYARPHRYLPPQLLWGVCSCPVIVTELPGTASLLVHCCCCCCCCQNYFQILGMPGPNIQFEWLRSLPSFLRMHCRIKFDYPTFMPKLFATLLKQSVSLLLADRTNRSKMLIEVLQCQSLHILHASGLKLSGWWGLY